MNASLSTLTLSILASLTLGACALDSTDATDAVDSIDEVVPNAPRLAANGLLPVDFWNNTNITSQKLTSQSMLAMTSTAAGRVELTYIVGCALASTQSITSGGYTFNGSMGIATYWNSSALTAADAGAISACLISRLNKTGAGVNLSLRGADTGFSTTGSELLGYYLEDGAFWGNIFSDLIPVGGDITAFACMGIDTAVNDTVGNLPLRECAERDPADLFGRTYCTITYAGACASICTVSGDHYTGCVFGGTTYNDVATAFVQ